MDTWSWGRPGRTTGPTGLKGAVAAPWRQPIWRRPGKIPPPQPIHLTVSGRVSGQFDRVLVDA